MSVYTSNDLEQADRTILASHLTSLERFAKAGKATQDRTAALGAAHEAPVSLTLCGNHIKNS